MTINIERAAWLFVFVGLIVFDLLNGFLLGQGILSPGAVASPSQLGRAILVVVLLLAALQARELLYVFLVLVTILMARETLSAFEHGQLKGYLYTLITLLKFTLPFLVLLLAFSKGTARTIIVSLKYGLLLIASSLILSQVLGVGEPTYTSGGFGTKGWFPSGNGIGIYLGAGTLILMIAARYSDIPLSQLQTLILFGGLLCIASKTALFFLLVALALKAYWQNSYRVLLLLGVLIALPYLENIIDLASVVFEIMIRRYEANQDDLLRFITSGRDDYVSGALASWNQQFSAFRVLFGGGIFVSFQDPAIAHSVDYLETDIFDVFFIYGAFGLLSYLILWTVLAFRVASNVWLLLPLGLLLLHSMIAGHVFFNGLFVQLVIALIAASQYLALFKAEEPKES